MTGRPVTTLFLLQSLDGKISTGAVDERDFDSDFPRIAGVGDGLEQYYEIERLTDRVSLNSGRTLAKVGANERTWEGPPADVSFVIVDSKPHMTTAGVEYFARRSPVLYVITANAAHPARALQSSHPNIALLEYEGTVEFSHAFERLHGEFGIERMTVQTGSSLNAVLLRASLIDFVSIVIAPCLVGGRETPSLIGGASIVEQAELGHVKGLELVSCEALRSSYVHLRYRVLDEPDRRGTS